MIRVVVADDQPLIRGGFRALLDAEDDLTVVAEAEAEAGDGAAAVEAVREHRPDVVLLDARPPPLTRGGA